MLFNFLTVFRKEGRKEEVESHTERKGGRKKEGRK